MRWYSDKCWKMQPWSVASNLPVTRGCSLSSRKINRKGSEARLPPVGAKSRAEETSETNSASRSVAMRRLSRRNGGVLILPYPSGPIGALLTAVRTTCFASLLHTAHFPPSGSIVALLTAFALLVSPASSASLHPPLAALRLRSHWRGRRSGATGGASASEPFKRPISGVLRTRIYSVALLVYPKQWCEDLEMDNY